MTGSLIATVSTIIFTGTLSCMNSYITHYNFSKNQLIGEKQGFFDLITSILTVWKYSTSSTKYNIINVQLSILKMSNLNNWYILKHL